jgi:antitoxin Phd
MLINTDYILSMTEANQNFSRVAKMVDQNGYAIIMKSRHLHTRPEINLFQRTF